MKRSEALFAHAWNGVELYQGEAYGSMRAHFQTVINGTHSWFKIVVPPCHDFCPERDVESVYFEAGAQPVDYPQERLQAIKDSPIHSLTSIEREKLTIFEVTPVIARACLASELPIFPHADGIY